MIVLIPSYLPLPIVMAGLVNIQDYEVWHHKSNRKPTAVFVYMCVYGDN